MRYVCIGLAVVGLLIHASPKINTKGIFKQLGLLTLIILAFLAANRWDA